MIDFINQGNPNNGRPIYNVGGFTKDQLEDALLGSYSWHNWENRVFQQNPNNGTRNNLDQLFDNWN